MGKIGSLAMTAALMLAACDRDAVPAEGNGSAAGNGVASSNSAQAGPAAMPEPARPPAVRPVLAGDGLSPGLKFGTPEAEAIAFATSAFGKPGPREHNDECGEGPMDFVRFADLQLGFQEGKLAGWSLGGKSPDLKTAEGIGIGTPRSALGTVAIDAQSSLGPEFSIADVGGIIGADGKVEALWAGFACQFR